MVRAARERVEDLFGLALEEGSRGPSRLADRYVDLARRVGTRHNLRIPHELREFYCRGCSSFWQEGRTVRTRIRRSVRVRTCLVCGAVRRQPLRLLISTPSTRDASAELGQPPEETLAEEPTDLDEEAADLGSEEDS